MSKPKTEHQRQLARERKKRYLLRKKIKKFGAAAAGMNMQGRHGNHAKGENHPRWNDGMATHEDGYIKIQVGKQHPHADPNGYAYLHLLVWLAAGGATPKAGELIHHKDENKTNNQIGNLELKTRSDHAKHHAEIRGRDSLGRFPPAGASA